MRFPALLVLVADLVELRQALFKHHFAEFGAADAGFPGQAGIPLVVGVIEDAEKRRTANANRIMIDFVFAQLVMSSGV